jgi:alanyl-tRNA synthetase
MTGHEIRNLFLEFFGARGHRVVKSSPLLPANDPTLLFANAGMNQFKDVFTGADERDYKRAASSQKCVRAGGKHNDLDEVGKTARHHTFFEMLGNFSFGDYFKEDAIRFAWDLLVGEMKLDPERLWFTVFEGSEAVPADDEAAELWQRAGARPERILRFGAKDNFWQMGDTGPCGPCSEIHYFGGDDLALNRAEFVNGHDDTIIEIWNLVFMQYERFQDGTLQPLPAPSVDTGMGLERIAAVMQGVSSNYETDLIRPIIDYIAALARRDYVYESASGVSMRVIADHARATAFLIADGIFPGNLGRAYVLRKIMRRALWHGRLLELETPFFFRVCDFVVDLMRGAYPELHDARSTIDRVVTTEERLFASTLAIGLRKLDEIIERTEGDTIAGEDLWFLYGTYGLREDLLRYALDTRGYRFDDEGFERAREVEAEENRKSWKGAIAREVREEYRDLHEQGVQTEFQGYLETETAGARVLAIIGADGRIDELGTGGQGEVVLDRTPFYAESGGQIGDTGWLDGETSRALVTDTRSAGQGITVHRTLVEQGTLRVGDAVRASVDAERRRKIRANHTATHLLHQALKEVLGPHVKQAGSLVAPDRLRFDFTHFAALSDAEILEIERIVNREIFNNIGVATELKRLEDAIAGGAVALFGEKYGDEVRVVSVPGFSTELCGGTHVRATGDIGVFKLVSDASIASGVRRVEAVTADGALERLQRDESLLSELALQFRTTADEVPAQVERLVSQVRALEKELDSLRMRLATQQAGSVETAQEVAGVKVLARRVDELDQAAMRQMADQLSRKLRSGVVVLGRAGEGKAALVVRVSDDLTKRVPAGRVVKELAAMVGGGGGGRADLAEAGGREPEKLDAALDATYGVVAAVLGA